jgi:hypothetical protein
MEAYQPMRVLAVCCALMLLMVMPIVAQDDPPTDTRPPLLRVLGAAPDTEDIRKAAIIASFADYQAALALRGLETPTSYADFEASDDETRQTVLFALPQVGPEALLRSFLFLGEMPDLMGFDFFQIAQAAEIGSPPANSLIFTGDFNAQTVIDAHIARGYSAISDDFGTLLCPEDGCESGAIMDLGNRQNANPFGGAMGQTQPIIVSDARILNARFYSVLAAMAEVIQGQTRSLADSKDVQAVANILAYRQYVSAVVLVSPAAISIVDATASSGRFSNFMGRLSALPPLPLYSLLSVSHTADAYYEYGDILLIYPDIDSASRAYESIVARLEGVESVRVEGRTIEQLYNEVGEFLPPQVVTDEKTNFSALQLTIRTPLETMDTGRFALAFNRLYRMLLERDTVLFIPTE